MRERDNLWKARAEVNADRLWRGADGAHVKLRDMTDDRIDFSLMLVLRSELQSQQPWAESFRMERERRGMPPIDPIEKRHAAVETAIVLILRDAREDDEDNDAREIAERHFVLIRPRREWQRRRRSSAGETLRVLTIHEARRAVEKGLPCDPARLVVASALQVLDAANELARMARDAVARLGPDEQVLLDGILDQRRALGAADVL